VSVVNCQVEVSATSWLLAQRSPTDCGVWLCVRSRNLVIEKALDPWGLSNQKLSSRNPVLFTLLSTVCVCVYIYIWSNRSRNKCTFCPKDVFWA
jgi:hypothetical protein